MAFERNSPAVRYVTPPPSSWKSRPLRSPTMPFSERKKSPASVHKDDLFHVIHKVPAGDSPYVKANQVQLVDKDPGRAISLFWAAINAGDRVESALKDMALVMKQLNRSDEAIEAIKSFRHLCPSDSQESLDNILVELYKRSGRVDEEIDMLHHKLKQIEDGMTFVGRTTKQARSQGKKIQITAEQEISRILGNLAWAYLQKGDYKVAEEHYRKALSFEVDRNKQCNLAIRLMQMNKITEARFLLQAVTTATKNRKMDDSLVKSYERATQMLQEMESTTSSVDSLKEKGDKFKETQRFSSGKSMSQYSTPNSENLNGKNSDTVKSRTENWSLTSDADESRHSHARRRLYESPDPSKVPFAKPKRPSWGFNNGYQREKTFGSGSIIHTSNTEAAMKFTNNDNKSATNLNDMVVNGANEFAASVNTDQNQGNEKPIQKKSWADMVEEEQTDEYEFFNFDGLNHGAHVFGDENSNSNIVNQPPLWSHSHQTEGLNQKLELLNLRDGYHASVNPTVRRSLFNDSELTKERDSFFGEEKLTRRTRLQVFQDITPS